MPTQTQTRGYAGPPSPNEGLTSSELQAGKRFCSLYLQVTDHRLGQQDSITLQVDYIQVSGLGA